MTNSSGIGVVGRTEPLERLGLAVSESADGRASAVLVSGEAGIGKTSLISAALARAANDTLLVGWGTCWHGDGAPSFWPWMQAFDGLVDSVGTDAAVAAAGNDREVLSLLVRDLGPDAMPSTDPDRPRVLLLDAAMHWLESLAATRHVVIVLDDLQWADSSTLDLIDYVISVPRSARLLVVGAFRHDELDQEHRTRIAAIASHAGDVHLEGLTVEAVEALIRPISGADASTALAADLHRRTGGHPLFVAELARLTAAGGGSSLPTAVTGAVTRRLDALPADSRRLLEVASVLGNRLFLDVLGDVTDDHPASVLGRLGPAFHAGLVRNAGGDAFWFTHDLYRETLYDELDAADRSNLHARLASALEVRSERGAEVAPGDLARHHVQAIADADPERAIRWAHEAAADERRRLAFSEAAGHLRRVRLAALDGGWHVEPGVLARLLIDEADNQARSGEPEIARGLLGQAVRTAPDAEVTADVALAVQRLGAKFSTPRDKIIAQLEAALSAVTGVSLGKQAQLTAALARELQHSVAEDRHRAGPLSEQALELSRQSEDDGTIAACLLARHDALWRPGTGVERAELGHEIAVIGRRLGDVDRRAEGLLLEANGLLESGSAAFRAVLDEWFALLTSRDEPHDRYLVETRRAAIALLDGDADRAEGLMHAAAIIGEQIQEPDTGNVLMSQRVALATARDEPDEWRTLAVDAVQWWIGAPVLAHAVAAGAYAAAGDVDAAGREVALVEGAGGWRSEGSYLRSVLVNHLAGAGISTGDMELCRQLRDDLEPIVGSCGVNGAVVAFAGPFAHTVGVLAAALGDLAAAGSSLDQSIGTARCVGATVWVERGERARFALGLDQAGPSGPMDGAETPTVATLVRDGRVWTVSMGSERGRLPHLKGLADIATLVRHAGQDVPALQLAGGWTGPSGATTEIVDVQALDAYRRRLQELDADLDQADADADLGRVASLQVERDRLLAEIGRVTGLGGRIRSHANEPAERARKAVTGRIRDAIDRLGDVAPTIGAHLDRSIRTGLRCSYSPTGDDAAVRWEVRTERDR